MAVIKGIAVKLQERALDVVKAYIIVDEVFKELESVRRKPDVFAEWFEQIESPAGIVDQSITIPSKYTTQTSPMIVPGSSASCQSSTCS